MKWFISVLSSVVGPGHFEHFNVASVTKELNFSFCLIAINLTFNCHTWLVATVLNNTALDSNLKRLIQDPAQAVEDSD